MVDAVAQVCAPAGEQRKQQGSDADDASAGLAGKEEPADAVSVFLFVYCAAVLHVDPLPVVSRGRVVEIGKRA